MKNQRAIRAAFVLFAVFSCASVERMTLATEPEPATGIQGVISVSPTHGGPSRPGIPDSKPLASVAFIVMNENANVASFTTDDQGRFRVSLAPGHYVISTQEKRARIGRCGPFAVDVPEGKMTKVEWMCDTGMR